MNTKVIVTTTAAHGGIERFMTDRDPEMTIQFQVAKFHQDNFSDNSLDSYEEIRVCEIKETTYYLFGIDAVRIYDDAGIEALIKKIKDSDTSYSTFEFIEGKTKSADLLSELDGWLGYAEISRNEFNQLAKL